MCTGPERARVAKGKNVVGLGYHFDRRAATQRFIAIEVFAHRTSCVPNARHSPRTKPVGAGIVAPHAQDLQNCPRAL